MTMRSAQQVPSLTCWADRMIAGERDARGGGMVATMPPMTREFPLPTDGERQILRADQLRRFLSSVTKLVINEEHGECWVWTKHLSEGEYGRFYLGKVEKDDGTLQSVKRAAHVVSYMHFVGPIPPGWIVDHMCNNKACCNPDHLEVIPELLNLQRATERRPWKRNNQYGTDHNEQPGTNWRHAL